MQSTITPLELHGLPYVHWVPSGALQADPSFGTMAGQPGVVGGGEQCHLGGGGEHGPPEQEVQEQIVPSDQEHTSPSLLHTVSGGGGVTPQVPGAGSRHIDLVVTQVPLRQVQSLRHSGRTSSP